MSFLKGKNVLLGVSGSIAAYKSILLLRLLKKEECNVKVILTKSALDFVTPLTFSTLSENQTYVNFIEENEDEKIFWKTTSEINITDKQQKKKFRNQHQHQLQRRHETYSQNRILNKRQHQNNNQHRN